MSKDGTKNTLFETVVSYKKIVCKLQQQQQAHTYIAHKETMLPCSSK